MATRTWLDTSGDWNATANWSGATVPVDGDTIVIDSGSQAITTNMDQSAIDSTPVYIGPGFTGSIGTPSSPLKLGTGSTIQINAPLAQTINLWPSTCTTLTVMDCNANAYGVHLYDGDVTTFNVVNGKGVRIGALANITSLYVVPSSGSVSAATVYIESGAAVPVVRQTGGLVQCYAAAGGTTLDIHAGEWQHLGTATGNIAGVLSMTGGRFLFNSPSFTITSLKVYGGIFDATQIGYARTITNAEVWRGGTVIANAGNDTVTFSNAVTVRGGRAIGNFSKTVAIPEPGYESIV